MGLLHFTARARSLDHPAKCGPEKLLDGTLGENRAKEGYKSIRFIERLRGCLVVPEKLGVTPAAVSLDNAGKLIMAKLERYQEESRMCTFLGQTTTFHTLT